MKTKLSLVLLTLCCLCTALLSTVKAQTYPLQHPAPACPDTITCPRDGGVMQLVQRYSGPPRAVYAHTFNGEYHSVQINCD